MGKTRDIALIGLGASLAPRASGHEGPREVHHHEHRAPTDESVKLLKEMEEKARDKIEEVIRVEGNGFNGVIYLHHEMMDLSIRARAVFDLNGKKMEVEHSLSELKTREELITGLRDKIATKIATEVLSVAISQSPAAADVLFRKRASPTPGAPQ